MLLNQSRRVNLPKYVKQFQELVGPSKLWPRQIRSLVFSQKHLNNKQRFTVTVFLLANGVSAYIIQAYFQTCFYFDSQAWRQIKWIIQKYPTSNWKQWNVALNKSI